MDVLDDPEFLRDQIINHRAQDQVVGFVPTMGALHDGHRKVIRTAREQCDILVVSIFVNPTQFDTDRDAEVYPRQTDEDHNFLANENVDYCFEPNYETMYPEGDVTSVSVDLPLTDRYEGEIRPRFFEGVARIVSKLFNIIPARRAFFGEKDLQQYIMLKRMVRDLHFPQELVSVPVARDDRGIAYSSRNRKFNDADWQTASRVADIMEEIQTSAGTPSREKLIDNYEVELETAGLNVQYLDVVKLPEYKPSHPSNKTAVLIVAGYAGEVRLKDNLPLHYESVRAMESEGALNLDGKKQ